MWINNIMIKFFISLLFTSLLFGMSNYDLGIQYYKKKDFKTAFNYFTKSANNNNVESQYILGYFYTGGIGTKRDLNQSLKWYKKASLNGHTNAQVNLGFMYIAGYGTKVDYSKAAYWIKKAKDQNAPEAIRLWNEFDLAKYYKEVK